jgi:hypothetical protein
MSINAETPVTTITSVIDFRTKTEWATIEMLAHSCNRKVASNFSQISHKQNQCTINRLITHDSLLISNNTETPFSLKS